MFMKEFSCRDVMRWISFKGKLQSVLENWKINHKNEKKTMKFSNMFIGSSVAQYGVFIRCMHFDTMRIQVHICFYQFDLQSRTRLVKNLSSKSSTISMFLTRN